MLKNLSLTVFINVGRVVLLLGSEKLQFNTINWIGVSLFSSKYEASSLTADLSP